MTRGFSLAMTAVDLVSQDLQKDFQKDVESLRRPADSPATPEAPLKKRNTSPDHTPVGSAVIHRTCSPSYSSSPVGEKIGDAPGSTKAAGAQGTKKLSPAQIAAIDMEADIRKRLKTVLREKLEPVYLEGVNIDLAEKRREIQKLILAKKVAVDVAEPATIARIFHNRKSLDAEIEVILPDVQYQYAPRRSVNKLRRVIAIGEAKCPKAAPGTRKAELWRLIQNGIYVIKEEVNSFAYRDGEKPGILLFRVDGYEVFIYELTLYMGLYICHRERLETIKGKLAEAEPKPPNAKAMLPKTPGPKELRQNI
ncbi:hypothetical protein HDU96_006288 [Phlyctochytrium bullatum]|nr:hypothetical protein HDU96_006288 [Phlyctochytrium bullatum]